MGAAFVRKYNTAATLDGVCLRTAGTATIRANPTLATGDVKISLDGGAFANLTTLPSAVPASGKNIEVALSAGEMSCHRALIIFSDVAGAEWDDFEIVVETFGNASAQFPPDYSDTVRQGLTALPNAAAEAAGGLYTRGTGAGQINQDANGRVDANIVSILSTAAVLVDGPGTGAYSCTWTVNDGTTVLQGASVRFTQGASTFLATTDSSGLATMALDAATYTVTITKAGYSFTPTTFAVSSTAGTHTHTFSMTAIVVSAAADPAMTNAYLTTYNSAGAITAGIVVTFEPQSGIGADGQSLPMNSFTATSSGTSSNNLTVALQRNRTYRAYRGTTAGRAEIFTTPDASTYQLPEVLGFDS